jgi:hypothetical protein
MAWKPSAPTAHRHDSSTDFDAERCQHPRSRAGSAADERALCARVSSADDILIGPGPVVP